MALHILFSVQNVVDKDLESEIVNELMGANGGGMKKLLEESPMVVEKCQRLTRSNKLLKESKEIVAAIMDKVAAYETSGVTDEESIIHLD
ncbi:hypothetical protein ACH5RR_018718 [Cinchona calisaya]|uniref:GED domain-containing protein n=1 Tax=Cinchona calisaya TaxID=153742 RepID=A0ABD2ZMP9_9GENT